MAEGDKLSKNPNLVDPINMDAQTVAKYNATIKQVQDLASTKSLIKNLVIRPAIIAGGGIVGGAIGSAAGSLLEEALAVAGGIGANSSPLVAKLLDYIASKPAAWKVVGKVGTAARIVGHPIADASRAATAAGPIIKQAMRTSANVVGPIARTPAARVAPFAAYGTALSALGGNNKQPQSDQPAQ